MKRWLLYLTERILQFLYRWKLFFKNKGKSSNCIIIKMVVYYYYLHAIHLHTNHFQNFKLIVQMCFSNIFSILMLFRLAISKRMQINEKTVLSYKIVIIILVSKVKFFSKITSTHILELFSAKNQASDWLTC